MDKIIVIGAGAAGLTTARILSKAGKSVTVLEARNRIGGRIFTSHKTGFTTPIETGAEFIHGDLPRTQSLAKEAGVTLRKGKGKSWNFEKGQKHEGDPFEDHWGEFMMKLNALDHDMSIGEFLNTHFHQPTYSALRESVIKFVQGFDAADASKASAFALREEWSNDDALTGYHLEGGYSLLMDFLHQECLKHHATFHMSIRVKEIQWRKDHVIVTSDRGDQFIGDAVIVTIPPAVLKAGSITFFPDIISHREAIDKIETGGVIKFIVEFNDAYWEKSDEKNFRQFKNLHFIFSDAYIPTWWTQSPSDTPLLTGWLSGPVTLNLQKTDEELMRDAIASLAYIFNCTAEELSAKIRASKVINWVKDPYALGAYAYKTVETPEVIKLLSQSVENTIYFAGEAYYPGSEMGTVEAALASGEDKAKEVLKQFLSRHVKSMSGSQSA